MRLAMWDGGVLFNSALQTTSLYTMSVSLSFARVNARGSMLTVPFSALETCIRIEAPNKDLRARAPDPLGAFPRRRLSLV
jgi:hypothetical protein